MPSHSSPISKSPRIKSSRRNSTRSRSSQDAELIDSQKNQKSPSRSPKNCNYDEDPVPETQTQDSSKPPISLPSPRTPRRRCSTGGAKSLCSSESRFRQAVQMDDPRDCHSDPNLILENEQEGQQQQQLTAKHSPTKRKPRRKSSMGGAKSLLSSESRFRQDALMDDPKYSEWSPQVSPQKKEPARRRSSFRSSAPAAFLSSRDESPASCHGDAALDPVTGALQLKQRCIDAAAVEELRTAYEMKLLDDWDLTTTSTTEVRLINCFVTNEQALDSLLNLFQDVGVTSVWVVDETKSFGELEMVQFLKGLSSVPSMESLYLRRVSLKHVNLGQALQSLLACPESTRQFQDFKLESCSLNQFVYDCILNGIRESPKGLRHLQFKACGLKRASLTSLVDVLLKSRSNGDNDNANNDGPSSPHVSALQSLNFSHSPRLDLKSFDSLAKLVEACTVYGGMLQEVSLRECHGLFSDADDATPYLEFCQAVERNKTLQTLDLGYCGCTDALAAPLHEALEANALAKTWIFTENHGVEDDDNDEPKEEVPVKKEKSKGSKRMSRRYSNKFS